MKTLLTHTRKDNGKIIEMYIENARYTITVNGVKWKHSFKNLQNAQQTFYTLCSGAILAD